MEGINKRILISMMVLASLSLLFPGVSSIVAQEKGNCSLTVKAWGFKNNNGFAMIGLWTHPEKWTEDAGKLVGARVVIKNLRAEAHFDHLACGSYAIALFQDANRNGILDKNFIGIPREGYGFSGKGDYRTGPAKFDEALVPVDKYDTVYDVMIINVL